MKRAMRNTLKALAAALLLPAGAHAHDRQSGPLYRMLDAVCLTPGHSLSERVAVLSEWRPATEQEAALILPAAAEATIAAKVLRGHAERSAKSAMMDAQESHLRNRIAAPADGSPGAARLLVLKENRGLALLINTVAANGLSSIGCQLLLRTPGQSLLEDLVARYDVMPSRADDTAKAWAAQSVFRTPSQIHTHERGLVLLLEGRETRAAIVETVFTVREE